MKMVFLLQQQMQQTPSSFLLRIKSTCRAILLADSFQQIPLQVQHRIHTAHFVDEENPNDPVEKLILDVLDDAGVEEKAALVQACCRLATGKLEKWI